MERILRSANQPVPSARRILELNASHPLIENLVELHKKGKTADTESFSRLLLDDALLLDGSVKDPAAVGRRIQDLLVRASKAALADGSSAAI